MHPFCGGQEAGVSFRPQVSGLPGLHRRGHLGLRDHPHVSAADAVGGEANVQGMRQTSANRGERLRSLLYGSVSVHLLLGAPGGGSGRGTRHSPENCPDHGQGNRAESPRPGDHLRTVPGREVRDPRHSVRQEVPRPRGGEGLTL